MHVPAAASQLPAPLPVDTGNAIASLGLRSPSRKNVAPTELRIANPSWRRDHQISIVVIAAVFAHVLGSLGRRCPMSVTAVAIFSELSLHLWRPTVIVSPHLSMVQTGQTA